MHWKRLLFILCIAGILTGCRTYRAEPLAPEDLLAAIERERRLSADPSSSPQATEGEGETVLPLPFVEAAEWLRTNSPGLKEARAAFELAQGISDVKTPLPNPALTVGAKVGSNLDEEGESRRTQPLVDFGFTIPLSGRLGVEDDVNRARADAACVDLVVEHRRSYLMLRLLYCELLGALDRLAVLENVSVSACKARDLTERLVDAGAASALDLGLMELDAAGLEGDLITARAAIAAAEGRLSRLTGVSTVLFAGRTLSAPAAVDGSLPGSAALKETLVANNPDLAVLRARYEVAEKELRLEIRKQYPDLTLGFSFDGEPGESQKVWGLGIGVSLPIFDRNAQGIARADGERARLRAAYKAALSRALADLEAACARLELAREKQRLLRDVLLPRSQANLDVALRIVLAAAADSHKYLQMERAHRLIVVDVLDAEIETHRALGAVEKAVGVPLGLFSGERSGVYPVLPFSDREIQDPNHAGRGAGREN
jgi:outer membrane protein, heavy metal efflux system